jgi:YcxB-like protein
MIPNEIKVECEIEKEDVIAWNNYYIQNAPKSKRSLKKIRLLMLPLMFVMFIFGIIFLFGGNFFNFLTGERLTIGIIFFLWGLWGFFYFLFLAKIIQFNTARRIRKNYKKGQNLTLGVHNYSISAEGINDVTEFSNSKLKWTAIEDIWETDKHLFIHIRPNAGYIIPKRAFPDEATAIQFSKDLKALFQGVKTAS